MKMNPVVPEVNSGEGILALDFFRVFSYSFIVAKFIESFFAFGPKSYRTDGKQKLAAVLNSLFKLMQILGRIDQ